MPDTALQPPRITSAERRAIFRAMTAQPRTSARRAAVALFAVGIALRLPGLLFNGMGDLYEILLDWGASVHHLGLVRSFGINYGILSYALFGIAEAAGEWVPRFWWAPYKLLVITFDAGACLALLALTRPSDRRLVLLLVWLNPWFILHGAYHGFWEGPHLLFGLLAVLALRRFSANGRAWTAAGALIMCSGMFKPHGLIHFAAPLGVFLAVEFLRGNRRPLIGFAAGMGIVAAVTTGVIRLAGGSALALYDNYHSALTVMPNLSNGGLGIWRFLSWVYMEITGQPGQVWDLKLSSASLAVWTLAAAAICLGIFLAFALRLGLRRDGEDAASGRGFGYCPVPPPVTRWPSPDASFACLTLGSLVLSQFGLHAHINHSYPAMVLLAPWAAQDRALRRLWLTIVVILAVAHFSAFGLGDARMMLPESQLGRYPAAAPLVAHVLGLPEYQTPDGLLAFQLAVNRAYGLSAQAVSLLSAPVCAAACGIIWLMFRRAAQSLGVLTPPPASDPPVGATAGGGTRGRETPAVTYGT